MRSTIAIIVLASCLWSVNGQYTGTAYYYGENETGPGQGNFLGACGATFNPPIRDNFVSMNQFQYSSSICGKCVKIECADKKCEGVGESIIGYVCDRCEGCTQNGIDISYRLFDQIAGGEKNRIAYGILTVKWDFVPCPSELIKEEGQKESTPMSPILTTMSIESSTLTTTTQNETPMATNINVATPVTTNINAITKTSSISQTPSPAPRRGKKSKKRRLRRKSKNFGKSRARGRSNPKRGSKKSSK